MFSLPNVTQPHPPSTCGQTSSQEFSGCLSESGSWSKLMAEQQSSPQCETYPPIYHTGCRHDVVAGECSATHPTYISPFHLLFLSLFLPCLFPLSSFSWLISLWLSFFSLFFFRHHIPHVPFHLFVPHSFFLPSLPAHVTQLYTRKHTQWGEENTHKHTV